MSKFNEKLELILQSYSWQKTESRAVLIFGLRANFDLETNLKLTVFRE